MARFGVPVKPLDYDPDPLFAVDLIPGPDGITYVNHGVAFDCRYGPESQEQIDWHIKNGTPNAERWEVGVPCAEAIRNSRAKEE
jgi:hypothetical protein